MSEGPHPPPWPDQQGGVSPSGRPADLLARFLARLIDNILLAFAAVVVVVVTLFGALLSTDTDAPFTGGSDGAGIVTSVLSTALYIAYFALMESNRGQTLGKMLMKVEVRGPDGGHPSLEAAIRRNLWIALGVIPYIGGLAYLAAAIAIAVTISSGRDGAGWHDGFAGGTRVVKV